ncbi:MAG: SDR family NAD(P)-dependent oxidoreductase [Pirellulaceae bacterium]
MSPVLRQPTRCSRTSGHIGGVAATIKADVSRRYCEHVRVHWPRRFGQLDILISNAAAGEFRSLREATVNHFEATMNTNVRALLLLARGRITDAARGAAQEDYCSLSSHGSHRRPTRFTD